MIIKRAYRTELDPNNRQISLFRQCCGASRFVYNWGLEEWERWYESGEKPGPSGMKLCKKFNAWKRENAAWIMELPYAVGESAFRNLQSAFSRYFSDRKKGIVAKRIAKLQTNGKWERKKAKLAKRGRFGYKAEPGYPQFKKKDNNSSFQLKGYKTFGNHVWLGRKIGFVRLKEKNYIPINVAYRKNGGATYITISQRAGRWFVSVQVEEEITDPKNESILIVGVDFGIKSLAVCSDGTIYENPKPLRLAQKQLKRLQRELSRRKLGGQNWHKTKAKIAKQHARIANIRRHVLHNISHDLIINKRPALIVLEDLNVSGMTKNHNLAQAIMDVSFAELKRQIEYKAEWHDVRVMLADTWFPSSKTCSNCGCIKENLTLADRLFVCSDCNFTIDRDLNAARNLAALGEIKINRQTDGDSL